MGAYLSSDQPLPDLPDDVIEQIIKQTPTSTLFASAIYVNKKWNDIGRRNAIWIPRYRQMTGETLNPAKFKEYEVFPLFMQEWQNRTAVYVDQLGRVYEKPEGVDVWIDTVDKTKQASYIMRDALFIGKDGELYSRVSGALAASYKPVKLLITKDHKNPRVVWLIREAGEPLGFEEDDFYVVSPQNELLGVMMEAVGSGSFNCALLVDHEDGYRYILRFAALKGQKEWTLRAIPRGAAIIHLFQEYKRMLGPALLEEVAEGHKQSIVSPGIRKHLCDSIKDMPGPFYVQGIEYLDGGHMPTNLDDREAQAFPLIWFLHVAQDYFNFRHGDLKVGNVVFRTYDPPQRFTFRYNEERTFSYEFHKVPVIIDFDFAGVAVTEKEHRRGIVGTPNSVPPEAALRRLKRVLHYEMDQLFEYDDWWSVGLILFEYWTGIQMHKFVEPYLLEYAQLMFEESRDEALVSLTQNDWIPFSLRTILSSYILIRGLYPPGEMPESPTEIYPRQILWFFDKVPNYGILMNTFQLDLLRQLFSWDPNERGKNILRRHFTERLGYRPDFEYNDVVYPSREALAKMREIEELK